MHEYNGMCQEPNACIWITPATFSFVGFHLEMLPGHWQFRPFLIAIELLSDVHTGALSLRSMSEHLLSDPQTHDQGNGRGGKVYHTFSSFVKSWAVNERRGANQVCLRHKFSACLWRCNRRKLELGRFKLPNICTEYVKYGFVSSTGLPRMV